jgi:predicted enzyme related to lactoylglutathione lyase
MYTFCWDELASTNLDAATKFYTSTLGWTATQIDMGGGMTYTLFKRPGVKDPTMANEDRNAGGAMASSPGVPYSYWLAYVAVPNADDTLAHAVRLGGRVVVPPMDIPNVGRFAVFQDPQSATLAVLQPAS